MIEDTIYIILGKSQNTPHDPCLSIRLAFASNCSSNIGEIISSKINNDTNLLKYP